METAVAVDCRKKAFDHPARTWTRPSIPLPTSWSGGEPVSAAVTLRLTIKAAEGRGLRRAARVVKLCAAVLPTGGWRPHLNFQRRSRNPLEL